MSDSNSKRFLGHLDAAKDKDFEDHFVESRIMGRVLKNQSNIIFGAKGVGKTALRRALTEINSDFYYATKTINLDHLSFQTVHLQLSKITDTVQTELPRVAQNAWRNILAIYSLEAVADELPDGARLKYDINSFLRKEGFLGKTSNIRVLKFIETLMLRLAKVGTHPEDSPLGLPVGKIELIDAFPLNHNVENLLKRARDEVINTGKYVLVCLDGLDTIQEHTREARQAIFAGLISAIQKLSSDDLLDSAFCYKAFLPHELAYDAHLKVWDFDKFPYNTHYLRWSKEGLKNFIFKRLLMHSKSKANNFLTIWNEFLPDKVKNRVHNKEESTLDYILRHTLYRPRQFLQHVQMILDEWDERHSAFKVDPSFIPSVVGSTNHFLAEMVITQLEHPYPGIGSFMQSWRSASNTMSFLEFTQKIERYFGKMIKENPTFKDTMFDDLYNYGIFGVASKASLIKGAEQTEFQFGYFRDRLPINLHSFIEQDAVLALSPMFHEYCGCNPSEYGIVIPVGVNGIN